MKTFVFISLACAFSIKNWARIAFSLMLLARFDVIVVERSLLRCPDGSVDNRGREIEISNDLVISCSVCIDLTIRWKAPIRHPTTTAPSQVIQCPEHYQYQSSSKARSKVTCRAHLQRLPLELPNQNILMD